MLLIGKQSINGPLSMAILNSQRVVLKLHRKCPGQGNYAAANANLDAFAPYWSAKGRPNLGIVQQRSSSSECHLKLAERCWNQSNQRDAKTHSAPQNFLLQTQDQQSQCSGVHGFNPQWIHDESPGCALKHGAWVLCSKTKKKTPISVICHMFIDFHYLNHI